MFILDLPQKIKTIFLGITSPVFAFIPNEAIQRNDSCLNQRGNNIGIDIPGMLYT